MTTATIYRLS